MQLLQNSFLAHLFLRVWDKKQNQEPSKDDGWGMHTSGAVFDSE